MELDRDALIKMFVEDATESLTAVEELLVNLERAPEDTNATNEILRLVHTIKGEAGCVPASLFSPNVRVRLGLLAAVVAGVFARVRRVRLVNG